MYTQPLPLLPNLPAVFYKTNFEFFISIMKEGAKFFGNQSNTTNENTNEIDKNNSNNDNNDSQALNGNNFAIITSAVSKLWRLLVMRISNCNDLSLFQDITKFSASLCGMLQEG